MSAFMLQVWRIPRLRTAVRLSLYNQMQPLVDARGLVRVSAYIDRARAHDVTTAARETVWYSQASRSRYAADMAAIDPLADQMLFGLLSVVQGHRSGLAPGHPLAERIDHVLTDLFPAGVNATTRLPYVEQVVAMERCVTRLQGPFAPLVAELALHSLVERLAQITATYRASVDAGHGRILFAEVRAARERGQLFLLEIMAMIVSEYHDADDPDQAAARDTLLAPVAVQVAIARAENRAQRGADNDGDEASPEPPDDETSSAPPVETPVEADDALVA